MDEKIKPTRKREEKRMRQERVREREEKKEGER